MGPSFGPIDELRRFVSRSWYEVTGKVSEGHLRAGIRVEAAKRWRQATGYAERYLAKPEEFPEGLETGRIWGVWNEELPPYQVGDGPGHPQGRLQDQEGVSEADEEEGQRPPAPRDGVREA